MPCITIKSLPLARQIDLKKTTEALSADFAASNDMSIEVISLVWDFFLPNCYAYQGNSVESQQDHSHPLIVEIYAPDVHCAEEAVPKMMASLAQSIENHTGIARTNVFIRFTAAKSGKVFEAGEAVVW